VSSPSNRSFEWRWRPSRRLAWSYALAACLAVLSVWLSAAPIGVKAVVLVLAGVHAGWVVPRSVTLSHPASWRALRLDAGGWQLWNAGSGWQSARLLPDSMALPALILLRMRLPGRRLAVSVCIPADSLPKDLHRQLRFRLKFSRQRWAEPE